MKKYFLIVVFFLVGETLCFSQQKKELKKDSIKTQIIEIETAYNPKIAEANKIKEKPTIALIDKRKKRKLIYAIFSAPVASTFIPKSGVAKQVNIGVKERIYNNFLALGYGNFNSPYLETYLHNYTRFQSEFGFSAKYIASIDNISNTVLDSDFSNLNAAVFYKKETRHFDWKVIVSGAQNNYNWYGVNPANFNENILNNIKENQNYNSLNIKGDINFIDSYLQNSELLLSYFSNANKSAEYFLKLETDLELPLSFINRNLNTIAIATKVEYLSGAFENNYIDLNNVNYSLFTLAIKPEYTFAIGGFHYKIGVNFFAAFDTENEVNHFLMYPNIKIQKSLMKERLTVYAGVFGDLQTNSYQKYSEQNPFISPTQFITQTNQKYNAFLGLSGLFHKKLSYSISLNAKEEQDKPLFVKNYSKSDGSTDNNNGAPIKGYEYGNSFSVVYDDVKTLTIEAEAAYEISRNFSISSDIKFDNFSLTREAYAWNLPNLQATFSGNFASEKWYAGTSIFLIGTRKEISYSGNSFNRNGNINVNAFVDVNLNGGYHFSDKFTAFVKMNNVLNNSYERFSNFNVQGFQILGGLTYKFDF